MADLKVLYHAKCFDGFASAAVFTAFYDVYTQTEHSVAYRGLRHGPNSIVSDGLLDGRVNAIVDFRYCSSSRLHWWFDHHKSAFSSPEDRAFFENNKSQTHHWDASEPSCAGFMIRRIREAFGIELRHLESLERWSDIIDAAAFEDAAQVVDLEEPVLQLMAVCEHLEDGALARRLTFEMSDGLVESVAEDPEIQRRFQHIVLGQARGQRIIESKLQTLGEVVFVDLTEVGPITYNKFLGYYLVPDCTYMVTVTGGKTRGLRIAVGSNPWRPYARQHDIATICAQYGGGGHAVVGGISLPHVRIQEGRQIALEIVTKLRGPAAVASDDTSLS